MKDFSKDLEISLVSAEGTGVPCRAELTYSKEDPFAVSMHFYQTPEKHSWVFARDLLWEGLSCYSGLGDVVVEPTGENELVINLSSPNGTASVLADKLSIAEFLQGTAALVPYGQESEMFVKDLDEKLANFFRK